MMRLYFSSEADDVAYCDLSFTLFFKLRNIDSSRYKRIYAIFFGCNFAIKLLLYFLDVVYVIIAPACQGMGSDKNRVNMETTGVCHMVLLRCCSYPAVCMEYGKYCTSFV